MTPARRSTDWRTDAGPLTKPIRRCPRDSRCSTAAPAPATSSPETVGSSAVSGGWSMSTTLMPRPARTARLSSVESEGVTMTPRTSSPARRLMSSRSRSGSESVEPSMGTRPPWRSRSSIPRAASVKKGLEMSWTRTPTREDPPWRRRRAVSERTKPSSAMAASTRSRVPRATRSGWLSTWETVPTETPASWATSRTEGRDGRDVAGVSMMLSPGPGPGARGRALAVAPVSLLFRRSHRRGAKTAIGFGNGLPTAARGAGRARPTERSGAGQLLTHHCETVQEPIA